MNSAFVKKDGWYPQNPHSIKVAEPKSQVALVEAAVGGGGGSTHHVHLPLLGVG